MITVNIYKKITDIFVKIVSAVLMLLVAGIVGIMLYELCLRKLLEQVFPCFNGSLRIPVYVDGISGHHCTL